MTKKIKIALIGATGAVGREIISILAERNFPLESLELFASEQSQGEKIEYKNKELTVKKLDDIKNIKADLFFMAAGADLARSLEKDLLKTNAYIIDKSSAFRERSDIPLIVPEVNFENNLRDNNKIFSCPNCVAIPLVQVLKPLHDEFGLVQVIVSTYQAVSGVGKAGPTELEGQIRDLFNLREINSDVFNKPIAFNVLPFIPSKGLINNFGKTEEEEKIIAETKKILNLKDLWMDVTCVRVPVFIGHSMSVNIATQKPINPKDAKKVLSNLDHLEIFDDNQYPTPLEAAGGNQTLVGRIRTNSAATNGLSLFISADNLRMGAALNSVKIAEKLIGSQE